MSTTRRSWLIAIAALAALATLAVALTAACSDSNDSPVEAPTLVGHGPNISSLVLTMTRSGACWGLCHNYTITIRGDGSFEYEGQRNVDVVGIRRGTIDRDDVMRLLQRLFVIGFFELPEGGCRWTDAPITTTSVLFGIENQTVVHCTLGDETEELSSIEASIDELTNSLQWTGPPKTPDYDFSDS